MSVRARTKLSSPSGQRLNTNPERIFAETVGQNCPSFTCDGSRSIQFRAGTEIFLRGRISEQEVAIRGVAETSSLCSCNAVEITKARQLLSAGITSPMCARRSTTSLSSAGNSRLSGEAAGRAGHDRGHPSLVGTRLLHSGLDAENCGDCRATRRTRFPRRKAIPRRQNILSPFSALSLHFSATATTK